MLSHSPTQKIFSSTNGFVRSGIVENLDEGDPEIIFYTKKLRV
ncbi:acetyltransferase [Bacillus cereus]|nr:acetyltransferase [Bacillus cereus]